MKAEQGTELHIMAMNHKGDENFLKTVEFAVDFINKRSDILPGYQLVLHTCIYDEKAGYTELCCNIVLFGEKSYTKLYYF